FLLILLPPVTPPLFPYSTLFRSYISSVFGDETAALPQSHIPDVERYVDDWSPLVDGGVIAVSDHEVPAGGAWLRYFTGENKGAAFMGAQQPSADPHDENLWATALDPETIPEQCIAGERRSEGQGLGELLLKNVVDLARAQDAPAIALWVDSENPRARKLYESAGFEDIAIPNAAPGAMIKYF